MTASDDALLPSMSEGAPLYSQPLPASTEASQRYYRPLRLLLKDALPVHGSLPSRGQRSPMSSMVLVQSAVSTTGPSAVINTSSSIRIPMLAYRSGSRRQAPCSEVKTGSTVKHMPCSRTRGVPPACRHQHHERPYRSNGWCCARAIF